jgi:YbbR domain-containing protein
MMKFLSNVLSNFATLLLSLVLAIIIWITATQTEDPTINKSLQIPIDFVGQPADTTMISPTNLNPTVLLWVQGRASIANEINRSDFTATVDLSNVAPGEARLLDVTLQQSEPDINIVSQSPEQLLVNLEQLITLEVPVEVDIRNEVARGHSRGTESYFPESITVTGTQTDVESLEKALVTVTLNGDERETKIVTAQPIFYDAQGQVASARNFQLSSRDVEVTIPINESADFAEKIITVDLTGQPATGYRLLSVSVEPTSVLVQGRPTQLDGISQIKTEPIDITGLTESFVAAATLDLPNGIELDEITEILVNIEIEPFESTQTINRLIEVQGLAEGLEATVDPDTARIVLFGPSPILDTLAPDEVNVVVDLFDLEEGVTASIEPTVTFPDRGLELRSIEPPLVTVQITRSVTLTNEITGTLPVTPSSKLSLPLSFSQDDGKVPGFADAGINPQLFIQRTPIALPKKTI